MDNAWRTKEGYLPTLVPVREFQPRYLLPKNTQADYTGSSAQTVETDQHLIRDSVMQLALALLFITLLTGCAESHLNHGMDHDSKTNTASDQAGSAWTEQRRALYDQAQEGLRQSRERYFATTRPALEYKFRQEHPELTDRELDALVNEALAQGYSHRAEARPDGPPRLPPQRPMNCMPTPGGWPSNPNCY